MGNGVVAPDGEIDRGALAHDRLQRPRCARPGSRSCCIRSSPRSICSGARIWRRCRTRRGCRVTEVPLLYETGGDARFDKVVVITAPSKLRRARSEVATEEREIAADPRPREGRARRLRIQEHRLARGARRVRRVGDGATCAVVRRLPGVVLLLVALLAGAFLYVNETSRPGTSASAIRCATREYVRVHAREHGLDPALVAAVIYQESKFDTEREVELGRDRADAGDARDGARDRRANGRRARSDTNDLYNPEINIRYGAWYLANLFTKYRSERARAGRLQRGAGQRRPLARERRADPVRRDAGVRRARRALDVRGQMATVSDDGPPRASPALPALSGMSGDPMLEIAENANTYTPLGPNDERIVTDRYVLWMGLGDSPVRNVAQRFRFEPGELDEVRAEIHGHLHERGRTFVYLGGRHARTAGRPRPAPARTRARR